MKHKYRLIFKLLPIIILLISCVSKPKVVNTSQPEITESEQSENKIADEEKETAKAEEENETDAGSAAQLKIEKKKQILIDKSEYTEVKTQIKLAEKAGANIHDKENLDSAKDFYDQATKHDDPAKIKELLQLSKTKAFLAYDNAMKKLTENEQTEAQNIIHELGTEKADRSHPDEYNKVKTDFQKAENEFKARAYQNAISKYNSVINSGSALLQTIKKIQTDLYNQFAKVLNLRKNITNPDSEKYAPQLLENAKNSYIKAKDKYDTRQYEETRKSLIESETALNQAIIETKKAITLLKRQKAKQALIEAGKNLEKTSSSTIVNDKGEVIQLKPYKFEFDDKENNSSINEKPDKKTSFINWHKITAIADEHTENNTDHYQLQINRAVELIEQAKTAYNAGEYEKVFSLINKANTISQAVKNQAVNKIYKVKESDMGANCLFRIAGKKSIYGNPYLWPKIWEANKSRIKDPDLIFPGQILVIP